MPKVEKPEGRKHEELRRAISNLRRANELWEQQQYEQSEHLASIIRLLLHEGNGKSIFKQHGMKRVDFYVNPVYVGITNLAGRHRKLAHSRVNGSWTVEGEQSGFVSYEPVYHRPEDALGNPFYCDYRTSWNGVAFEDWWRESVLHGENYTYTREELVLTLANRLGGSHSDPKIYQYELDLLNDRFGYGYTDLTLQIDGVIYRSRNKVYEAVIRQIAYEVERTLAKHFPEHLNTMEVVPPIPDSWRMDIHGIGVKVNRTPDHEMLLYEQNITVDGEWSGISAMVRSEIYWNKHKIKMRKIGL